MVGRSEIFLSFGLMDFSISTLIWRGFFVRCLWRRTVERWEKSDEGRKEQSVAREILMAESPSIIWFNIFFNNFTSLFQHHSSKALAQHSDSIAWVFNGLKTFLPSFSFFSFLFSRLTKEAEAERRSKTQEIFNLRGTEVKLSFSFLHRYF